MPRGVGSAPKRLRPIRLPRGLKPTRGCVGISILAYAKYRGCGTPTIYKALRDKRISRLADGSIDPIQADLEWRRNTNITQPLRAKPVKALAGMKAKRDRANAIEAAAADTDELDDDADAMLPAGEAPGSLVESRKRNVDVRTARDELNLRQQLGTVVDRDNVKKRLFVLARTFRDAVTNWPARVAAEMAAELDVDPRLMLTTMERHVAVLLGEIAETSIDLKE